MDLQMHMYWRRYGSIISIRAWRIVKENEASGALESKVSISAKWLIRICRTWGGVFEVLGTWDDKLLES